MAADTPGTRLSIAIIGTRGVPPVYGGFETFAAELGTRLAARGHDVTVYCRASLYRGEGSSWNGVTRIELPAIRHKYFETVSHSLLSALDAFRRSFDVAIVCNAANAFVLPLLRVGRTPVAINVDGIERNRRKWNALGRFVYLMGEAFSAHFADRVIADAEVIARYYRNQFAIDPDVLAYGSGFPEEADSDVLARFGLEKRRYVLYVSRFEPENNPEAVVAAYADVRGSVPLVMVGDAPYADALIKRLETTTDSRVLFPGALYGPDYRTLQRNALVYIQATEVGGTHPALIEAMSSGGAVLANDTPENREVGGDAVRYFRLGSGQTLTALLQESLDDPGALDVYRTMARDRARSTYDWSVVTDRYESLLFEVARAGVG
jgi:glycosyltransferase involved in cell wall biosynthesis